MESEWRDGSKDVIPFNCKCREGSSRVLDIDGRDVIDLLTQWEYEYEYMKWLDWDGLWVLDLDLDLKGKCSMG